MRQNFDLTAFTSKSQLFCRPEETKRVMTPWKWILRIFKYKNEYLKQLELKKSIKNSVICLVSFSLYGLIVLKGYLHYKTILCHKVALDVELINFFIWRKNIVSFSRYRDFCVFVKPAEFKICGVIISITA